MSASEATLRVTVFTALGVETEAMLAQLKAPTAALIDGSVTYTGSLRDSPAKCDVSVVELGPGNIDTAMAAGGVRGAGTADILLFVGIAGALKDLQIGDVVAATEVVWLHRGKVTDGQHLYRPQLSPCTSELVSIARYTTQQRQWPNRLGEPQTPRPQAFVGQVLSGEQLIKDAAHKAELGRQFSDARAIENEGFGLARAGTATLKVLVIRGASDFADRTKSDSDQGRAAHSAAAFAAQLICDYISLSAATPPDLPDGANAGLESPGDAARASADLDRASTLMEALRSDVDLIEDAEAAVTGFANAEYDSSEQEVSVALIQQLTPELDTETDTIIARRLRWFGRTIAGRLGADHIEADWDGIGRMAPSGAAVLMLQQHLFSTLSRRERRRALSGLLGHSDSPKIVSTLGWTYLHEVTRANDMLPDEQLRIQQAQMRTPYPVLLDAGYTLPELMHKLVEDLESGIFESQNAAARALTAFDWYLQEQSGLSEDDLETLAVLLLSAASAGSFGAQEATSRTRMSSWPADVIAGALWGSMTGGRNRLDSPSTHLRDVLAAATRGGTLESALDSLLRTGRPATIRPLSEQSAEEDREWLEEHGSQLPASAQVSWSRFLTQLFEAMPRLQPE